MKRSQKKALPCHSEFCRRTTKKLTGLIQDDYEAMVNKAVRSVKK